MKRGMEPFLILNRTISSKSVHFFPAAFIESHFLCARVEVVRASFHLCYLSVWYHKSALQLSTRSLKTCSFMAFTTDASLHIVFFLVLEYLRVQSWAPLFVEEMLGQQMAVWCSRLSTVRSEWAGNEISLLLLRHLQTTHPRLHIKDLRDRFTTKDFPLCHYRPHPGNYGGLVTQA